MSRLRGLCGLALAALSIAVVVVPATASARGVTAGGSHACAVSPNSSLTCWGDGDLGQTYAPAGAFKSVDAGLQHTCGVRSDDTLLCWGNDQWGQSDPPSGSFKSVSSGGVHSCAVNLGDTLQCWGDDDYGEASPPSGSFSSVSAGDSHSCGIRTDDSLVCWGLSDRGQADPPSGSFQSVSAGGAHTCAIRADDSVACWGYDGYGQATPPSGAFQSVSAGEFHTCGVRADNSLACWGDIDAGQAIPPSGSFQSVSAGEYFTCGVRSNGAVACWGADDARQTDVPPSEAAPSAIPTGLTASPASPSNDNEPNISGAAEPGATIRIYTSADCSGDPAAIGGTADFASPGLTVQVEDDTTTTFHATATDATEAVSACSSDSATYAEDSTPPTAAVDTHPGDPTNSTTAAFTYSSSEAGSSFECRLDSGAFGSCPTSGTSYSALEEGEHTFAVRATDVAGNTSAPESFTWTVDLTPPTASVDTHPADPTNSTAPAFTYSASEAGSSFECSLDSGSFTSCPPSGVSYSALAAGEHTFSVRATDVAGNTGAADSFTWTVDLTPPTAAVDAHPADPSNATAPVFTYSSDEAESSFECKLDAGSFDPCPADGTSYSSVGQGEHTFAVRAIDQAGNTGDPVSFTWTIDTTAPSASIENHPPDATRSTAAAFTYSSTEPGSTFECRVDSGSFDPCPADGTSYEALSDGSHTFSVRATDLAGNTGDPDDYTWSVNTAAPIATVLNHPSDPTNATSAAFTYSSSAEGSDFACKLDGGSFSPCPGDGKSYAGLGEGEHIFSVRATDAATGTGDATGFSWRVDTTPPAATIESGPYPATDSTSAAFTYSSDEGGSSFECRLDSGSFTSCPTDGTSYTGLSNGSHTLAVRPTDAAGNTGEPTTFDWSVDTTGRSYRQVSAGAVHTCAVRADGSLLCWGSDESGQASPPTGTFASVSAGYEHTCAIRADSSVVCWGSDSYGQTDAPSGSFKSVSAGGEHTCAIRSDDAIVCWGSNSSGQATPPSGNFLSVSAGEAHTCAIRSDDTIACWGDDSYGQTFGTGGTAESVSAGEIHSCSIDGGWISCWGQSLNGARPPRGEFSSLSAGFQYTCAVSSDDGSLACWGDAGQGGANPPPSGSYRSVSSGGVHTCAIRSDDWVVCWGLNTYGQVRVPDVPPPDGLSSSPASPANHNTPLIAGAAESGSTVRIYASADCSGDPVAEGSAAEFSSPGLPVTVADDSTSTFHATAANDGQTTSVCSDDSLTYVEDSTPPTATAAAQGRPSDPTNSTSGAFSYSADERGSTFECRLDSDAFSSCPPSGSSYSGLAEGRHTFSVRATDPAGNTGPPDDYAWTVDLTPPVVAISSAPPASDTATTASFAFTSSEAATFVCRLDSQTSSPCQSGTATYAGLSLRQHLFRATATDAAGNSSTESSGWTVIEPSAPTLTLLAHHQRVSRRGVVEVARLRCAEASCFLRRGAAEVKVGGTRWGAKVHKQGPVPAHRAAKLTIVLPKASRRALAKAGTGRVAVKLFARSADGERAKLSGRVKLRAPS